MTVCWPEHGERADRAPNFTPNQSIQVSTTKLITLTAFLTKVGINRMENERAKQWCAEVGIEIIDEIVLGKGKGIIIEKYQAEEAWERWTQKNKPKTPRASGPEDPRLDRFEDRMASLEVALDALDQNIGLMIKAQNIVADHMTVMMQELGVKPVALVSAAKTG